MKIFKTVVNVKIGDASLTDISVKEIELENKIKRLEESSKAKDRIIHNLESLVEVLEDSNKLYKTLIK